MNWFGRLFKKKAKKVEEIKVVSNTLIRHKIYQEEIRKQEEARKRADRTLAHLFASHLPNENYFPFEPDNNIIREATGISESLVGETGTFDSFGHGGHFGGGGASSSWDDNNSADISSWSDSSSSSDSSSYDSGSSDSSSSDW